MNKEEYDALYVELYKQYSEYVMDKARIKFEVDEDSHDLAQYVWAKIYTYQYKPKGCDSESKAYLKSIVHSCYIDMLRDEKKHWGNEVPISDEVCQALPNNAFAEMKREIEVNDILNQIPEKYAWLLRSYYIIGYTQDEIADQIGLTRGHVSKLIKQGLEAARNLK